jgi:hypothetical protein
MPLALLAHRALPRLFQWSGFLPFSNEHFFQISRTMMIFLLNRRLRRGKLAHLRASLLE